MRLYWLPPLVLQNIIWLPGRLLLDFFCHLEVRGLENLEGIPKERVIFAANHASELDPIVIRGALPALTSFAPMFYAADRPVLFRKGFSWRSYIYTRSFFRAFGAYSVYTGLYDFEEALRHQIWLLEDGVGSVTLFPEGRRTKDGLLQEGKPGIVYLAARTNSVVIPVGISGTFKIAHTFFSRKQKIVVNFGKPLFVADLLESGQDFDVEGYKDVRNHRKNFQKGTRKVMEEIEKLLLS